jgi:hypothetical protein
MPSIWSNAKQAIMEILTGPRTVDTEFNDKLNELKDMVHTVENIIRIYHNFHYHTEGLKKVSVDISCLKLIYPESNPYSNIINDLINSFKHLEDNYDKLVYCNN